MSDPNQGFRLKFNDSEAIAANKTRKELLLLFVALQHAGHSPEDAESQAMVERYRNEYIDVYLFTSSPIQIFALGTAISLDPYNRMECEEIAEGLADFLSQAMLAYYHKQKEQA